MATSRRAQRMERHHKRSRAGGGLNLVSLMDIFTILVFFLLVNSGDVETLPSAKSVKLPESLSDTLPKQTVVITVNDEDILVQGRKIASVPEVLGQADAVIAPLQAELVHQAKRVFAAGPAGQRDVTIMGDKEIPYRLLKKIMVTCARASYDNISLAVMQKEQNS